MFENSKLLTTFVVDDFFQSSFALKALQSRFMLGMECFIYDFVVILLLTKLQYHIICLIITIIRQYIYILRRQVAYW